MDRIVIESLRVETVIGAHEWERRMRQSVTLDLELAVDARRAARADDLGTAVDYAAVGERIAQFVGASRFVLLEALAEAVAARVLDEFDVPWLKLGVRKPGALRGARAVGVVIERGVRPGQGEPGG